MNGFFGDQNDEFINYLLCILTFLVGSPKFSLRKFSKRCYTKPRENRRWGNSASGLWERSVIYGAENLDAAGGGGAIARQ